MEYRRFQDHLILRMDRGEEIQEQLKLVCQREQVQLASVSALGAVNDFTVGVFETGEKKYYSTPRENMLDFASIYAGFREEIYHFLEKSHIFLREIQHILTQKTIYFFVKSHIH